MSEIKVEFVVQMKTDKCVENIKKALEGMGKISIDTKKGRVIIETSDVSWFVLKDKIEETGSKAVLAGFGGQSAVAMINTTGGVVERTPIQGIVRFSSISKDKPGVVVDGVIDGLARGLHGIHIHESGDISQGCATVGDHYNPRLSPHGGPQDGEMHRHAGDLGNLSADKSGRATFRFVDPLLEVWDIIGRSVVITEEPDDLGRGLNDQSLIDGNSGKRLACGIIARSAGILENYKMFCACDGVPLWDERNKPVAGGNRAQKL